MRANLHDLRFGKNFLNMMPKSYITQERKDKLDFIKI